VPAFGQRNKGKRVKCNHKSKHEMITSQELKTNLHGWISIVTTTWSAMKWKSLMVKP